MSSTDRAVAFHPKLMLVGLAALTSALPLNKANGDSLHQAHDSDYTKYADYHPYYSYNPYPSAVEAESAKTQQGTLRAHPSPLYTSPPCLLTP